MLNSCATLVVSGGLTLGPSGSITTGSAGCQTLFFSNTQTISGSGIITLNTGQAVVNGTNATLTIDSGVTVQAGNNSGNLTINAGNTVINKGLFRANAASRTLAIGGAGSFTNDTGATVEASATGTVNVNPATWTNSGTFLVNNGTLNLGGTYASIGTVSRTGGTITLGGTFNGPTLTANASTGTLTFAGATVAGSTLGVSDGQSFIMSGGTLFTGVTLNAPLTLSNNCNTLSVTGGLTLGPTGSITTGTSGCQTLFFSGTQTVAGTGTVVLNSGSAVVSGTGAVLTIGPGVTIRSGNTSGLITVNAGNALINQGTLSSSASTRLTISDNSTSSTLTNTGLLQAQTNGEIVFTIATTNNGTARAGSGGLLSVTTGRTFNNTASGTIEIEGTGPNSTSDFGHVRVSGTLIADGSLVVTYPNGLVPGCRIGVPIVTEVGPGTITGTFDDQTGPNKPSPFAVRFGFNPNGNITFSSTNLADVGSAGGEAGADGLLDNNDFIVFIDLFFALDPLADRGSAGAEYGSDGLFDNNDFIVFIDQFFSGCG